MKNNGAFCCFPAFWKKSRGKFLSFEMCWIFQFLRDEFGFLWWRWLCFVLFSEDVGFWSPTPSQPKISWEKVLGMRKTLWLTRWFHKKERIWTWWWVWILIYPNLLALSNMFSMFLLLTTDSYCWCFKQNPVHHHYVLELLTCIHYMIIYVYLTIIYIHHHPSNLQVTEGGFRLLFTWTHPDERILGEFSRPNVVEKYIMALWTETRVFSPLKKDDWKLMHFPVFFWWFDLFLWWNMSVSGSLKTKIQNWDVCFLVSLRRPPPGC